MDKIAKEERYVSAQSLPTLSFFHACVENPEQRVNFLIRGYNLSMNILSVEGIVDKEECYEIAFKHAQAQTPGEITTVTGSSDVMSGPPEVDPYIIGNGIMILQIEGAEEKTGKAWMQFNDKNAQIIFDR